MCSVNFNNQFGMNVKQYQQMRFGTGVRTSSFNPQLNFNTGVFTAGKPNLFASANTNSLNFNGVQYDNKYQMLNNVSTNDGKDGQDTSLKSNIKSLFKEIGSTIGSLAKGVKTLAVKGFNAIKSLFKKGDSSKSGNVDKALGDIKNAQDKETLQGAVDSAVQEQGQIENQQKQGDQALKGLQGKAKQAGQAEQQAGAKVDQSNEQLSSNESKLEQAKADYNSALDSVENAQYAVADAENGLTAAKNAATPDNPNTAAIQQAEAQVQSAKQAEIAARQKLQQAEQAQTQAQQAVDASKQQVDTAEAEHTQAQQNLDAAEEQVNTADEQQQTIKSNNEEITDGVNEGNKKLEEMNNNPSVQPQVETQVTGTDPTPPVAPAPEAPADNTVKKGEMPAIGNSDNDLQVKIANSDMDTAGLNAEQREQMISTYNQINNLQPGQSVVIDGTTYAKGSNGEVTSENNMGKRTLSDGQDGLNAGAIVVGEQSRKIGAQKEDDEFVKLYEKDQQKDPKVKQKAPKPEVRPVAKKKADAPASEAPKAEEKSADVTPKEVDTKSPGAKWSKTTTVSGDGFSSKERVTFERNEDGTITERSVRGTRILDEDGKKLLFEKSKTGGLNNGNLEVDHQKGTRTTDIGSMKGSMTAGTAVTMDMERRTGSDNVVLDKEGNTFVSYKDGQFYNAKGKKISKEKANDLIYKHRNDGLKYVKTKKK